MVLGSNFFLRSHPLPKQDPRGCNSCPSRKRTHLRM